MNLSAIVLTHNNQDTLPSTLGSLKFAQETLVIDDHSSDDTVAIAKKNGARVVSHKLIDFSAQRNFALRQAKHDWVLFVDSDELVTPELRRELTIAISSSHAKGYYLPRQDMFFGILLKHGETANAKFLRLARKDAGLWQRAVHEFWDIKGETLTLRHPLLHNRSFTYSQFINKLNSYTDLDAKALLGENKTFKYVDVFTKPVGKFIYNYFYLLGILDGFPGFIMAFSMSLHSLMVRIKLYEHV